ncbi:thiamine-phosphate kinase [Stenotrophomonas sp. SORGH_AS_0321]|uniref:thiamine-phosphate kinase n=1 Tax=Stenotrophomonas sp. SORGH_AS_0321 TaxID=3041787 RepID=UPI002865EC68|nr:thiamine-phosphate kinase [Stenotrophomonas sp. SORGH_AS_0321]MDR6095784.1 thiamine-monophosphate kinase [Stenotrophomonas sp. SORGH_AS_0321]
MSFAEFALIDRIRARSKGRDDIVLGIGDDAALLQPLAGHWLAVTADTLNSGVHFPPETMPADIGWKTLAVNLSDLAAMGATPAWGTLALSLPEASEEWIDAFADGFFALADAHEWRLIGGDTTRGALSLSVTAFGQVPHGQALRRDGAQVGDDIWVSGTLGDAAAALHLWQRGALNIATAAVPGDDEMLRQRLLRPTPRVALGLRLRAFAHAAVDISDGLLADLGHITTRSGVGAVVDADALPLSPGLRARFGRDAARACALRGGDDYELCFTAAANQRDALHAVAASLRLPLTRIGRIVQGHAVQCEGEAGPGGYQHFA